jgi:hypothetical protein
MSFSGNYAGKYQVQIAIVALDSNSPPRTRRRQQEGCAEASRQDGKEAQGGIVQPIEMGSQTTGSAIFASDARLPART